MEISRAEVKALKKQRVGQNEPKKFAKVHKVFGASNVSKILIEVPEEQQEDTVNSLAYVAEVRLGDPVYGCIGAIAVLQRKMIQLQHDLALARACLAWYTSAMGSTDDDRVITKPFDGLSADCEECIDSFSQNLSYELNQESRV
ncbi:Protein LATERAL ORGAN BOUNDARIES [Hibiscus syriacus]|uniref:Protein LATERAL ORGAN BOUNDARIES n=1 Tax=Hibiscus syriacus TaxID=106335 RepID=A0A6A2Z011_HIBSY|nr:Protein LATERAL ORGAN BOUNDARIES [Hibiscus syriacus]